MQDIIASTTHSTLEQTVLQAGQAETGAVSRSDVPKDPTRSPLSLNPERLLVSVLGASPFAKFLIDSDGQILTWNAAAEALLGYSTSEIIGRHTRELMPPTFGDDWRKKISTVCAQGNVNVDSVRRHKNGRLIDVTVVASSIKMDNGVFVGCLITLLDRRVREEENASNARLATIIRTSPLAVVSIDLDLKIQTWNAAATNLFGFTPAEAYGQAIAIIVPKDLRHESANFSSEIRNGKSIDFQSIRQHRDGRRIPVSVVGTPIINTSGSAIGWAIYYNDISDRLEAQRNLRESEEFSRSILEASLDWIVVLGNDERVIYSNRDPSCSDDFGPDPGVPAKSWFDLWPAERKAEIELKLQQAYQSGSARMSARYAGSRGEVIWYDLLMIRLPAQSTGCRRMLVTARDITEKKETEDHVQLIIGELSHRAKNLLAVITAMARSTSAESKTLVEFEEAFCSRIYGLARSHDLLVQQNWLGVRFFDLVRQHLHPFLNVTQDRLVLTGENLMVPPADAQTLGMAFHELATNAVKYGALSNANGRIRVACSLVAGGCEIQWSEVGGPVVAAPKQQGFGRVVIEEMIAETFGCQSRIDFRPTGVVWSVVMPTREAQRLAP